MRPGPERELVDNYLARAGQTGRASGFGPFSVIEIDERKARGAAAQSARLIEAVPAGARTVALDERGEALSSDAFAELLVAGFLQIFAKNARLNAIATIERLGGCRFEPAAQRVFLKLHVLRQQLFVEQVAVAQLHQTAAGAVA